MCCRKVSRVSKYAPCDDAVLARRQEVHEPGNSCVESSLQSSISALKILIADVVGL